MNVGWQDEGIRRKAEEAADHTAVHGGIVVEAADHTTIHHGDSHGAEPGGGREIQSRAHLTIKRIAASNVKAPGRMKMEAADHTTVYVEMDVEAADHTTTHSGMIRM
ncbi:hypothetical protein H6P81_001663 [Aristolochia fimbriata]|uniref:Uncharacterized protein n=1 Tax=Aristolochia fimbriata TaxID=158543 RepID=A0AAV7F7H9_ARIFI|nr:hypothetical protein H6P81_001663 [Aristolochia fimbriata]